ncbi:hypothetical protein RJI07_06005 [Mycoplasmatota bacterium WC30]
MDERLKSILNKFANSKVQSINEYYNICFICTDTRKRYIQLDGFWRVFQDKILKTSSEEKDNFQDLKKLIVRKEVTKLYISKHGPDLILVIEGGLELQLLTLSSQYENWVVNQEVICLPGGEIDYFID